MDGYHNIVNNFTEFLFILCYKVKLLSIIQAFYYDFFYVFIKYYKFLLSEILMSIAFGKIGRRVETMTVTTK